MVSGRTARSLRRALRFVVAQPVSTRTARHARSNRDPGPVPFAPTVVGVLAILAFPVWWFSVLLGLVAVVLALGVPRSTSRTVGLALGGAGILIGVLVLTVFMGTSSGSTLIDAHAACGGNTGIACS